MLLLAGCSAVRLAYNQAPHVVYWWLNGYVEFDTEQGDGVHDALAEWFAWHRATQLPDYAGLLATAQRQILHDVTPGEVCQWVDVLRKRIDVGYEHGVPAMAELVRTLKAPQLQRLERRYRKADEEFRDDYLQADRGERLEETNKRARSRAEFIAKLGTVLEESDESLFWLELVVDSRLATATRVEKLLKEADELTAIFVASIKTAKR